MVTRRRALAVAVVLVALLLAAWWLLGRPEPPPTTASGDRAEAREVPARGRPDRLDRIRAARSRLAPALPRRALRGVVVDAGGPVAGAVVALAAPRREVVTDAAGRFAFDALPPARVTVEAHAGARIAGPVPVELAAGDGEVTLRLYQGHALEVEVVRATDGRPIAGAAVEAIAITMHDGAGRRAARTGADGIARLDGLVYVGHDLHVSAPGYADARRGPGPDQAERGPHLRRVRVALDAAAVELTGQLVDEAGAPVAGGTVEAVAYQAGQWAVDEARQAARFGAADPHASLRSGLGAVSDADGRFRIGLPPGTWVVVAAADGRAPTVSEPVFAEGEPRRDLTIVLSAGRTVRGVVVTADDAPVAGAGIEARWLDGTRRLAAGQADGTGAFELRGLPPAPIELVASTDAARSRPLAIDLAAADRDDVVVALELTAAITGTVVDDRGAPVADAIVTYLEDRPGAAPSLYPAVEVADARGRFVIRGVAPRVGYFVSAARPQDGSFAQHATGRVARAGDEVTLTIPSGGAIVGRIAVPGDPQRVVVRDLQTLTAAHPDRDGRFRLDGLPPLRYQLRLGGPGLADTYRHDVDVRPGETVDVGTIELGAGRRVAGVVVDAAGAPLDDATVRVEVGGDYAVAVRPRGHRFTATVPSGVGLVVTASHPTAGRALAVAVPPDGPATGLTLAMQPGATIRGAAVAGGQPLAEAQVAVWPADGPRPGEPWAAAITDDAGAFALRAVPAGRWDVELLVPGEGPPPRVVRRNVELDGATAELVVELDATGAPAGTVVPPPPGAPELPVHGEEGSGHDDEDHHE